MIHQFLVIDREKSVGVTLYNNDQISLQSELLISLVQALMILGHELGPVKGSLREAELGKYQISILSKDHLAYVAIQDTYDSEPFTKQIMENIVFQFHQHFLASNLNTDLDSDDEIKNQVNVLLQTMKFPKEKLNDAKNIMNQFIEGIPGFLDTLFLADLDDGIIDIHRQPVNDGIIKLLMEILSEIPFERHWLGQTKLSKPIVFRDRNYDHELWIIYRIDETDYCILGRIYYKSDTDREEIIRRLEVLTDRLYQLVS